MVQSNKFVGFCARLAQTLVLFTNIFLAHEFHEFTRNMLNYINGDLIGRTNFH